MRFRTDGFSRKQFFKTPLIGIDLSTSEIKGVTLSKELSELRGATLSADQALALIRQAGIGIR